MAETIKGLLKKFEQEHEVYVDARDTKAYWVVTARIPRPGTKGTHHLHKGIRFVTAFYGDGNVLVLHNPDETGDFFIETWKKSPDFEGFVKLALDRILEEVAALKEESPGCGSECA